MSYTDTQIVVANQDYLIGTTTPAYPNGFQADGNKDTLRGKSRNTHRHDVPQPLSVDGSFSTYKCNTSGTPTADISDGGEVVTIHEIEVNADSAGSNDDAAEFTLTLTDGVTPETVLFAPVSVPGNYSKVFDRPLLVTVPAGWTLKGALSPATVGGQSIDFWVEVCLEKEPV